MQTSTITARSIDAAHVGNTYPFSAQKKGDKWYAYDATENEYRGEGHTTAADAHAECEVLRIALTAAG
ncbi:hypothetical protein HOR51_gp12 [Ralstonia phage phiAp1]|uniref:Uncharacterized protein n=1 Tax=Ralstonia phage phiAp1 TaxID=2783867 RepID=A0A1L7DSA7_9CAUD|nr:hypothetical protein HOR51_gp12 [Ralstonia phage phiAp1]APU03153.1 hypothetical protein phiAp1_12 [Ralstonia phage phiAp1]